MEKLIIEGGNRLFGSVEIQASKNSVLPLLAASILTDEQVIIENYPEITDVDGMLNILVGLGCRVTVDGNKLTVDGSGADCYEIKREQTRELRSSIFMLGSVLARFSRAKIAYPGGCDIGLRPIGLHIDALQKMGVRFKETIDYVECDCKRLHGATVNLSIASVGATENIMLAGVLADGQTIINNSAKEPEIVDLQNFLNKMGAKITGAGSETIIIEGVNKLKGCRYKPISDRIEAGTFLLGAAICGGRVELVNASYENNRLLLNILRKNGCKIDVFSDKILIESDGLPVGDNVIETAPYPNFPTDLQAPFCAFASVCDGTAVIVENLFETRFKHLAELQKMGANVKVKGKTAVIKGVKGLHGANLSASDLRAGGALAIAALCADGVSVISNAKHIYRGYSNFINKINGLGGVARAALD